MLKLLSFQPVCLYQNGGASRVLRRLYSGREKQVISVGITENAEKVHNGPISEIIISAFPVQRRWMRWKLRNIVIWLREQVFVQQTMNRTLKAAKNLSFDVIHLIHHGPYSTAFFKGDLMKNKQLWVSFHDHYSTAKCTIEDTARLWDRADRRLMISEEMAEEYQRLFGTQEYEIITDGISTDEMSIPRAVNKTAPVIIYFSGLLHIGYYPLFETLADALDLLAKDGAISFNLVLRGTQRLDFLNNRSFKTEYRSGFISDIEIKKELDEADILYLPIKFTARDFYLYSLSTKMVSYLGAPGAILYHGPLDSAANRLLKSAAAAVASGSLDGAELAKSLTQLLNTAEKVSKNAKILAKNKFDLVTLQNRFWQTQPV